MGVMFCWWWSRTLLAVVKEKHSTHIKQPTTNEYHLPIALLLIHIKQPTTNEYHLPIALLLCLANKENQRAVPFTNGALVMLSKQRKPACRLNFTDCDPMGVLFCWRWSRILLAVVEEKHSIHIKQPTISEYHLPKQNNEHLNSRLNSRTTSNPESDGELDAYAR
jgi:hypothetical protein